MRVKAIDMIKGNNILSSYSLFEIMRKKADIYIYLKVHK